MHRPAQSSSVKKKANGLSLANEKNATPVDGARPLETVLDDIRPTAVHLDRDASACIDPAVQREGALERYGDLHIQIGAQFVTRWNTAYTSQALPL